MISLSGPQRGSSDALTNADTVIEIAKSSPAHTLSDHDMLAMLILRFLSGGPMPESIALRNGTQLRLVEWLASLASDRSEFHSDAASRLGMSTSPPLTCEVALTLRDRIADATR